MIIIPAIDLYEGKVVRLFKGDYANMKVYGDNPVETAVSFASQGATHLHVVDLKAARDGIPPDLPLISEMIRKSGLSTELGGGIRSLGSIGACIRSGVDRVILGTAALDPDFLGQAVSEFGNAAVCGADIKDGKIAVRGWTELSALGADEFFDMIIKAGVKNVICTDISKDGAMSGTSLSLYKELSVKYTLNITASGGVCSVNDIKELAGLGIHSAILGKALYEGAVTIKEALEAAEIIEVSDDN